MITPQLEQALKSREILRLQEGGVEVRLYDTDQVLVLGTERRDSRPQREGNKRIVEEFELPAQVSLDLRTGLSSYSLDTDGTGYCGSVGGSITENLQCFDQGLVLLEKAGIQLHKWADLNSGSPQKYPELSELVNGLNTAFVNRKWERQELAIKGFIPTLLGHGNVPPWFILHPRILWAYFAGTVFPFERKEVFDFEQGRSSLEQKGEYLDTAKGVSYDGNAVLIKPWSLSRKDETDQATIEANFFNPRNYQRFLDGALKVENLLPSKRDWIFQVTYGIERHEPWLHFDTWRFDNKYRTERDDLLSQNKNDLYLKADDNLVDTLERIAPLPI